VLLVFFVHYHALFAEQLAHGLWVRYIFQFLGTVGNAGVDLFFVLSGYLIYGALIQREVSYFKFVRRRIQRIYPTFLAVMAVYLVLSAVFSQENKIHGGPAAAMLYVFQNLLLLPGVFHIPPIISVAWSLSFEFCFYLTVPLLISFLRMRGWKPMSRVLAFGVLWIGIGFLLFDVAHANQTRMISFVAGILLYELRASGKSRKLLPARTDVLALAAVVASFVLFYAVRGPRMNSRINGFVPVWVLSAAFFLLCACSFEGRGFLGRAFSWTPLRYLGNMSYSYYLIHGLTLQAIAIVGHVVLPQMTVAAALALLVAGFLATLVTSTLLFVFVEKRYSLRVVRAPQAAVAKPVAVPSIESVPALSNTPVKRAVGADA
jgi:peptidoglycan/LPS O-acetylase OafA/YrhL